MENENDRGTGAPRPGDEWASGPGAGPGGYGQGGYGPGGYGQRPAGENPYGAHDAGRQPGPANDDPPGHGPAQAGPGPGQYGPAQPGQYGHVQAGSAQPNQGWGGPGQPTTAMPPHSAYSGGDPDTTTSRKSGRGLVVAGLVAAMLISGGLGGWIGATVAGGGDGPRLTSPIASEQPEGQAPDGTVEAVADKVLPSVVSIDVRGQAGRGEGSGVVLTQDGLIITNNHVIGMAATGGQIQVRFDDGSTAPATVVGTDPATDIAVIRADTDRSLTPIALGSSSTLDEGQAVAAVGSPLGLSGTVTTGIVSALDRPVRAGGAQSDQNTVIDAIQTDAAVNPGNSGGALVNMNGELVGINSAIASLGSGNSGSIGLGFAIPVDQARRIADQLIKQGFATRAVLGVSVSDQPDTDGALVRTTEVGGPAEQAGIEEGAVITKVGERVIEGGDALVAAIRSRAPGETISVTYAARVGEQPTTVDVVLGEAR
ncbi:trypsin-like peptidase domain-containing protein [Dietzia psychralcaliphila]|uniref:trypsin-like peptidase domain-containing protein n=1 Tax=Dietzia psychralcaliphila TaxID=139021 RepID=UPI001C1E72C7|nr:trypsin-like peptidase domain-containing protein [Dietzia psychralcaliphila]